MLSAWRASVRQLAVSLRVPAKAPSRSTIFAHVGRPANTPPGGAKPRAPTRATMTITPWLLWRAAPVTSALL